MTEPAVSSPTLHLRTLGDAAVMLRGQPLVDGAAPLGRLLERSEG